MSIKILFIEDEANERLLYTEELKKDGYEVLAAANGREGLAVVEKEDIALVVLDLHMPEMDGLETLGRILTRKRNIPVIIYTAFPQYKDNFISWAADAYLQKSFDLTALKSKIKEILDKKAHGPAKP